MSPSLKICENVIKRLTQNEYEEDKKGYIYGILSDSTLLVVGFTVQNENDKASGDLQFNFPTEVDFCGIIQNCDNISEESDIRESLQDVDMTDNPLVLTINKELEMKTYFLIHDRLEETSFDIVSQEELTNQFAYIRVQATFPLVCEATINGVKTELTNERKKISSGQIAFHFAKSSIYLFDLDSKIGLTGANLECNLDDVISLMSTNQGNKGKHLDDILTMEILIKATRDSNSRHQKTTAVKMVTTQGKPSYSIKMPIILDALAMINRKTKVVNLYSVLVETACRSLKLHENNLIDQLDQVGIGDGAGLKVPEPYHFLVPELNHFVTVLLPKDVSDDCLNKKRLKLHTVLQLSTERPLFRRGNAYHFEKSNLLINPHEAIPPQSTPDNVIKALVKGKYAYHHYMQDKFDDNGWGCAYRSLQTIVSWMRYQGYTNHSVPSHKEIQECLVKIGDKQSSFIGSKQWIGSTEISYILETLLGIKSKIIFADSGSELNMYAPELIHHFQNHGSPIMIGGGVLAHTLLGVEYNTLTRETRYLVLDPHYVGVENLSTVISKGWCGWKNSTFWDKTAHYNLCLPQIKKEV